MSTFRVMNAYATESYRTFNEPPMCLRDQLDNVVTRKPQFYPGLLATRMSADKVYCIIHLFHPTWRFTCHTYMDNLQ